MLKESGYKVQQLAENAKQLRQARAEFAELKKAGKFGLGGLNPRDYRESIDRLLHARSILKSNHRAVYAPNKGKVRRFFGNWGDASTSPRYISGTSQPAPSSSMTVKDFGWSETPERAMRIHADITGKNTNSVGGLQVFIGKNKTTGYSGTPIPKRFTKLASVESDRSTLSPLMFSFFIKEAKIKRTIDEMQLVLRGLQDQTGLAPHLGSHGDFVTLRNSGASEADLKRFFRQSTQKRSSDVPYKDRVTNFKIWKRLGVVPGDYRRLKDISVSKGKKGKITGMQMPDGSGSNSVYGYNPKAQGTEIVARGGSAKHIRDVIDAAAESRAPGYMQPLDHMPLLPGKTRPTRMGAYVYPEQSLSSSAMYANSVGQGFGGSGLMRAEVPKKSLLSHIGLFGGRGAHEKVLPIEEFRKGNLRNMRGDALFNANKMDLESVRSIGSSAFNTQKTVPFGPKKPSKKLTEDALRDKYDDHIIRTKTVEEGDNYGPKKGKERFFEYDDPNDPDSWLPKQLSDKTVNRYLKMKNK